MHEIKAAKEHKLGATPGDQLSPLPPGVEPGSPFSEKEGTLTYASCVEPDPRVELGECAVRKRAVPGTSGGFREIKFASTCHLFAGSNAELRVAEVERFEIRSGHGVISPKEVAGAMRIEALSR